MNSVAKMDGDVALKVQNLSKCYRLFPGNKARLRQIFFPKRRYYEEFWALKDISFEVKRGEALGIIGANGAGKSTLLQILAGILRPTLGGMEVNGRVSALLELGAGFDLQFTGRENTYMNGAIMGLSRHEVTRQIDEIRDFSGIGDFFDRPVRMYSSGMYVRLAFAVATALDPDVLILDEILAVGDEDFQKKCLKKMRELRDSNVTVLFVSHSLNTIRYFCNRAILLHKGELLECKSTHETINAYYERVVFTQMAQDEIQNRAKESDESTSGEATITSVQFLDRNGKEKDVFSTGEKVTVRIHYETSRRIEEPSISFALYSAEDKLACAHTTVFDNIAITHLDGRGYVDFCIDELVFLEGFFRASIAIADQHNLTRFDWHQKKYNLKVVSGATKAFGVVYLPHHWEFGSGTETRQIHV